MFRYYILGQLRTDACASSETAAAKRRHFFIRDMVESMKIEVPFVRTADNIADFFTKPMKANKFHAFRKVIMNEA